MKKPILTSLILAAAITAAAQEKRAPEMPKPQQLAWQRAELGVVFHYDLHVFDGKPYGQGNNRLTPIADHNIFHPSRLNVEQWVLAAKAAGARFAIITATHETGFALYQSDVNPYCLKALKWKDGKADIVKDFTDACRKHGILPGIYIGLRWNAMLGVHDFQVNGTGEFRELRQQYYRTMAEGMVKELCTKYGPLFEIWFDGGAGNPANGAPDVLPIVKKYQPDALFYHNEQLAEARWGGSESGTVGYPNWSSYPYPWTGPGEAIKQNGYALLKHGDPAGTYWVPAMADAPLRGHGGRHEWFWEPGDEKHIYPLDDLMRMYEQSVGRNATLIMGLTPDTAGLLPEPDVQRLQEWGEALRARYLHPLKTVAGKGKQLTIQLPEATLVNQLVIRENIELRERIRAFKVEVKVGGRWKPFASGTSVGNKFIFRTESPVKASAVRLVVTEADDMPDITEFSIFNAP